MQIPQNVISTLSTKGKGYVEATMKLAEGLRLVEEATLEMAHLDGKKIDKKTGKLNKAGGDVVTTGVRDLAKHKFTATYLKSFLKDGALSTGNVAKKAGCSYEHARRTLKDAAGVYLVGGGNQVRWSLMPDKSSITRKPKTAPKVARKTRGKPGMSETAKRQAQCDAADPAIQKADEEKILKLLEEKPASVSTFMSRLKRSYYPVLRALKALEAGKRIRETTIKREKGGSYRAWERT